MKIFAAALPIGLGDLIYAKAFFEPVKHEYSQIKLAFHRSIITDIYKNVSYNKFLDDFGQLLFGESPYCLVKEKLPFCSLHGIMDNFKLIPHKPNLSHLLCKGSPLILEEPYIVINTKIRSLSKSYLNNLMPEFWNLLSKLATKYKVVILGEREIEMNGEYMLYTSEYIYSLYPHILNNIPINRIQDLTIPALGITSPTLQQVQQDCLIMNQAAFVIIFGIGGGFCMATAVANTIGFRQDDDRIAEVLFNREHVGAFITKDWGAFINKLTTAGEL